MTVIATFWVDSCPILLGDLVVSSVEHSQSALNIPTVGDITEIFPEGSGFVPTGLRQKIAVLNDNLVVAWSGSRVSAQTIIGQLRKECQKRKEWSFQDLSVFLSDFDKDCGRKVGILGYSNNGKGIFSFCYGGVEQTKFRSDKYRLVRLCGTGASDLRTYLEHFTPQVSRTTNPLERAVGNTLFITTYMMGLEATTRNTLLQYYGGGFEISSFVRKKFAKIDDITYLIWVGRQKSDLSWEVSPPERCIKYYYADDVLLIRKVEFKQRSSGTLTLGDEAIYIVSPIYRNANDEHKNQFVVLTKFQIPLQFRHSPFDGWFRNNSKPDRLQRPKHSQTKVQR